MERGLCEIRLVPLDSTSLHYNIYTPHIYVYIYIYTERYETIGANSHWEPNTVIMPTTLPIFTILSPWNSAVYFSVIISLHRRSARCKLFYRGLCMCVGISHIAWNCMHPAACTAPQSASTMKTNNNKLSIKCPQSRFGYSMLRNKEMAKSSLIIYKNDPACLSYRQKVLTTKRQFCTKKNIKLQNQPMMACRNEWKKQQQT